MSLGKLDFVSGALMATILEFYSIDFLRVLWASDEKNRIVKKTICPLKNFGGPQNFLTDK